MTKKQLRKNWRRGFAVALTAAMVANSTLPSAAVFASEFSAPGEETEFSSESNAENAQVGDTAGDVQMDDSTGDTVGNAETDDAAAAFSAGNNDVPVLEDEKRQYSHYCVNVTAEPSDTGKDKITQITYSFEADNMPSEGNWQLYLWKKASSGGISAQPETIKTSDKVPVKNGSQKITIDTSDLEFEPGQSYMLGMVMCDNDEVCTETTGTGWPKIEKICDAQDVSDLTIDKIYINGLRSNLSLSDLTASEHKHSWEYSSDESGRITAECKNCYYNSYPNLYLWATSFFYNGKPYEENAEEIYNEITKVTGTEPEITYSGEDRSGKKYGPATQGPVNAGTYKVSVTLGGKTISDDFYIYPQLTDKINPDNVKWENVATYDGSPHGLKVWVEGMQKSEYTISYRYLEDEEGIDPENPPLYDGVTTENPVFTEPGRYLIYIRVEPSNMNYMEVKHGYVRLTIKKADFDADDISATPYEADYDGKSHPLISVQTTGSTTEDATVTYSTSENGTYTSTIPERTNAGTYDVWYKVSKHGYEDYIGKVTADITTRALYVKPKAGQSKVYGTADPENFEYEIEGLQTDADREEASKLEVKITRDPGEDVGLYKFKVKGLGFGDSQLSENYDLLGISPDTPKFEITKADPTYLAPEAVSNLVYDGEDQTLITAGETRDGTMQYKVGNGDWDTELPTGMNAGDYKVSYRVVGDDNHNDYEDGELTVSIAKRPVTVTANDAEKHIGFEDPELTYTTSSEEGLIDGEELNGISLSRKEGETAGTYEITATINSEDGKDVNPNYEVEFKPGTFTIHDHEWGDWKTLNEATAWSEGKKEAQCTYKDENGKECAYVKYESIPKTGEKEDANKGKLEKDAQVAPEIQKQIKSATLGSTESEILNASGIFDDTERKEITDGSQKAKVWVELSGIDPKSLPADDQKAILEEAGKLSTDNEKLVYFNAELFRRIGNGAAKKIEDPKMNMKLTVRIPDEFLTDDSYVIRDYKVIRLHNGNAEILDGRFDQTTKEFTFETDKFSTYVLAYKDTYYSPSYPVTDVTISQDTATLTKEGETLQLTATVKPSYADNKNLTWKSSDEKVATVDENGKVTAVANGTAVITATSADGKHSASVTVTVNIPVPTATPTPTATPAPTETPEPTATPAPEQKKLTVKANKTTLTKIGDSLQITAKVEPADSDVKLIWKSSNEKVAIVDANGKVTAAGTGTAKITVTTEDGSLKESVTVTVKVPDEPTVNKTTGFGRLRARSTTQTNNSIKIQWNKVSGADGYIIYGNYCNANGKTYKYSKLKTITNGSTTAWTQTKLKKGTFYKYIVKAYKVVNGKKVITDTSASIHVTTAGGKYGVAKSVSVTKIGSKKNTLAVTLKNGKTAQITASEVKKDKKIKQHRGLCYESSNTKVATVTPDGLIQATGKGSCTVWVYAQNGVYKAITVTVK